MQKEECIEIFERYIQNRTNQDEVTRLSLWIKTNQKISSWLEQQIISSPSIIDSEVQTRMLRCIEDELDLKDKTDYEKKKSDPFSFE